MELPIGAYDHETSQSPCACATVTQLLREDDPSSAWLSQYVPLEGAAYRLKCGLHIYWEGNTLGSFDWDADTALVEMLLAD